MYVCIVPYVFPIPYLPPPYVPNPFCNSPKHYLALALLLCHSPPTRRCPIVSLLTVDTPEQEPPARRTNGNQSSTPVHTKIPRSFLSPLPPTPHHTLTTFPFLHPRSILLDSIPLSLSHTHGEERETVLKTPRRSTSWVLVVRSSKGDLGVSSVPSFTRFCVLVHGLIFFAPFLPAKETLPTRRLFLATSGKPFAY